MTTAQILEGALQTLRTRGWHQGSYTNKAGGVCVQGACHVGAGYDAREWECIREDEDVYAAIEALMQLVGPSIPDWNDSPERTFAEVEALLTAAIAIASEQGSGCRLEAVLA